ncbi:hypothetical protein K504DRAFT_469884 [Pleomassaria siparia CBS 279.74]|uniref:FYVE-type domain-containing protein n=1 Tax=Pleomassaria siparia CBS 279.74 TaxID=1314801 RepID=A0A6G1KSE0_9PLEO|nr:hypothetical protein K504DRAFT_469884 [Pleomassaria siparia CBS 279.74]
MTSQPAPYHQHAYKTSAHYNTSMGSGANTPANISPTSPRSTHLHLNRIVPTIEPRKTPVYVPAALRRTEKPNKHSPPKVDSTMVSPNNSWSTGANVGTPLGDGMPSPISRIHTEDLNSLYNDAPLSPTAGPITKNHWQSDTSTNVCTASACQTPFGWFNRRHHCRKCGGVFCWQHSQKLVKLDENATFHPNGIEHRACDRCHSQFREWQELRTSRHNSESSGSTTAPAINTPIVTKRPENQRYGSLATSVQNAWNWSTF